MIHVIILPQNEEYECRAGESLLECFLRSADVFIDAPCAGNGRCGKCRVQIVKGDIPISSQDKVIFSPDELAKNFRLACCAKPTTDCTLQFIGNNEAPFQVISDSSLALPVGTIQDDSRFGIAIDIGTTTIAVQLIDLVQHTQIETASSINHQRAYGSDVISRMMASNEGKKDALRSTIQHDILDCLQSILNNLAKLDILPNRIETMAITANTTMIHLLCGLSCESLGVFPFTPVEIGTIEKSFATLFDSPLLNCPVTILPGISTYVGADIVSGMNALGFAQSESINLLVDLGTNGEMAIGNKDRVLCTSVAAGPAFEGGNISCGTGSIPGAISSITITDDNKVDYKTISDKPPAGICGTGVVECVAELLRTNLIDETGALDDGLDDGFFITTSTNDSNIRFTQKDVREIQLAKSAVRAGMEVLISEYGIDYAQINKVYIAGGFGFKLDHKKAIEIGMFPSGLADKIESAGNTSLLGAVQYLLNPNSKKTVKNIVAISTEIALSTNPMFNDLYMEHMMFE